MILALILIPGSILILLQLIELAGLLPFLPYPRAWWPALRGRFTGNYQLARLGFRGALDLTRLTNMHSVNLSGNPDLETVYLPPIKEARSIIFNTPKRRSLSDLMRQQRLDAWENSGYTLCAPITPDKAVQAIGDMYKAANKMIPTVRHTTAGLQQLGSVADLFGQTTEIITHKNAGKTYGLLMEANKAFINRFCGAFARKAGQYTRKH